MDDTEDAPGRSLYDQETPGTPGAPPSPAVEGDEPRPADADAVPADADAVPADIDAVPWDAEAVPTADEAGDGTPSLGEAGGPAWAGLLSGAGLGLAVVQGLVLLGTVAQGMVDERFAGDLHKIGYAVANRVDSANGLMLLVAAVLAGLPSLLGITSTPAQRRRRALTFALVSVLAVALIIGTPLAVRAQVHVLDLRGLSVDAMNERVLATYVAGTLGAALVALGTSLGLARLNRTETPQG